MTATNLDALLAAADLSDRTDRLMLADVIEESGRDHYAGRLRAAGNEVIARWAIDEMHKADDIATAVRSALYDAGEIWTRERAKSEKGYDARKAEALLAASPETQFVVISGDAPTKQGLRIVCNPSGAAKTVLYYRKSSGGKFGRSSQQVYVTA